VVEGAALEKQCMGNRIEGSNPSLSASNILITYCVAGVIYKIKIGRN
jgi:hypothetical protein